MNRENERLKNKILDLAIRGKLVPQDINDEPASVLLERIKQERKKLIAEKKIKQEKYSEIYKDPTDNHYYEKFEDGTINDITEEIPFDIPNTWCWSKLKNIGSYKKGPFGSSLTKDMFIKKNTTSIKVYEQKNAIQKNATLGEYYISEEYFLEKMQSFELFPDDIIVSCAGTIGESYIMPHNMEKGIINQALMKMKINSNININYFLMYFDYILKNNSNEKSKGSVIKNIPPFDVFKEFYIPLPPVNEQIRIFNTLENIINLIKCKNDNEIKVNNLKECLKSKILDKAIQGKLIKQNEDNESAEILINKILDEKRALMKSKEIKKENLSIIYKDSDNQFYEKFDDGKIINITEKIPFDIPKNWRWSRLSTICTKIVDGDHNPPQGQNIQTEYIMLSAKNIQNNQLVNFSDARFLSKEDYDKGKQRILLKNGDILLTIVGTLGRSCIYKDIGKNILFQRSVSVISTLINNNYLKYVFDSSYIQNKMQKESTGTAQRGFYLNQLNNVLIPVPPINEEFFIINKLKELLKTAE